MFTDPKNTTSSAILRLRASDVAEAEPPIRLSRRIDAMAVSRDGSRLVAAAGEVALVLDPWEPTPAIATVRPRVRPYLVALSPDGRAALLADDRRTGGPILRLDTATAQVRELAPSLGPGVGLRAMSLSPGGAPVRVIRMR